MVMKGRSSTFAFALDSFSVIRPMKRQRVDAIDWRDHLHAVGELQQRLRFGNDRAHTFAGRIGGLDIGEEIIPVVALPQHALSWPQMIACAGDRIRSCAVTARHDRPHCAGRINTPSKVNVSGTVAESTAGFSMSIDGLKICWGGNKIG